MLALAEWANDRGGCFPSMESIASRLRVSRSQAQRTIHKLIDAGWILVEANHNGGPAGSTRHYRINLDRLTGLTDATRTGRIDATGSTDATGRISRKDGPHLAQKRGRMDAALTTIEPKKRNRKTITRSDSSNPQATRSEPACAGNKAGHGADSPKTKRDAPADTKAARGLRLHAAWFASPTDIADAISIQPTWTACHAESIAAAFRDYWISIPGQRGLKLDWSATWRNWVRKSAPLGANGGKRSNHGQQRDQERADLICKLTGGTHGTKAGEQSSGIDIEGESIRVID